MKRKNNLDERQEQILLSIEHNGCWIAFWGLLVVFAAEAFLFHYDFKTIVGEWTVFMILTIYLFIACMKNGIWDRRLKPNFKTNLIVSVIASVVCGILMSVGITLRAPGNILACIAAGAMTAVFVFIPCILLLTISSKKVMKIIQDQEDEPDDLN